jgi:hypothetical protein
MQRFAANALPLNVQQFSRFRSKADIWPDFMSTRPNLSRPTGWAKARADCELIRRVVCGSCLPPVHSSHISLPL